MKWTRENVKIVAWVFGTLIVTSFFVTWTFDHDGETTTIGGGPTPTATVTEVASGDIDPVSGLPWVREDELPVQAQGVLALIDEGGPFPYDKDGATFGNFEALLPDHPKGYYHEYTVVTPGSKDRGARRIVTGDGGEFYWTQDHYASFSRIARRQT